MSKLTLFFFLGISLANAETPNCSDSLASAGRIECLDDRGIGFSMNVEDRNITNIVQHWIDGRYYEMHRSRLRKVSDVEDTGKSLIVEAGRQYNAEFETFRFVLTPKRSGGFMLRVTGPIPRGKYTYNCE